MLKPLEHSPAKVLQSCMMIISKGSTVIALFVGIFNLNSSVGLGATGDFWSLYCELLRIFGGRNYRNIVKSTNQPINQLTHPYLQINKPMT